MLQLKHFQRSPVRPTFSYQQVSRRCHGNRIWISKSIMSKHQVAQKATLRGPERYTVIVAVGNDDVSVLVETDSARVRQAAIGVSGSAEFAFIFAGRVEHLM